GVPQPWQASVLARPSSRYFAVRSDPSRRDSDGDLRDDPREYAQGTDPLEVDYYTRPRTPSSPGTGQRPAAAIYTAVNPSATESYALFNVPELRSPGRGVIRVNGFIDRFSDGPAPFINAAGDDRRFDSGAPYWKSRVYMEIDHERGQLLLLVNPSCTVGRNNAIDECYSALPIRTDGEPGVGLTGQENNWFVVSRRSGAIRLRLDLGIADPVFDFGVAPRSINPLVISGFLELPIAADGTASWPSDAQMKWRKDPYPSWEVYRDSPAGVPVQTLYRWEQTDAGPWALNEFNWWDRGLCLRYNEDRSIPDAYNWIARGGGFWSFIGLSDLRCPSGLWTGW
ncbi:MAG: hypothetical protein ACKO5A_10280, partial [Actinomycetota bacterium]